MLAGLTSALIAGVTVGLAGRLVPRWRGVPIWLPMVIGVVAAVAGTFAVGTVGAEPAGVGSSVAMQLFFAAVGVLTMGSTATRRAAPGLRPAREGVTREESAPERN